jgi:hypothetical protein
MLLLEEAGAAGDVGTRYASSSSLTQTTLDGLASSATWVAGWTSVIDNSSALYLDYAVNAKIQVESASLSAGEIRLGLIAELEDASWPDTIDGTSDDVDTLTDTEIRDAIVKNGGMTITDTTGSRTYPVMCASAAGRFDGSIPRKFSLFITQSTTQVLETTGDPNQVYVRGQYANIAQS